MTTVWKVRQRLLREQLERLAERLSGDKPPESAVMIELTVRLLSIHKAPSADVGVVRF